MKTLPNDEPIIDLDDAEFRDLILEELPDDVVTPQEHRKAIKESPWEKGYNDPNCVPFIPGQRLPFCFYG